MVVSRKETEETSLILKSNIYFYVFLKFSFFCNA